MEIYEYEPWSINMLPIVSAIVTTLLEASKKQLSWLSQADKVSDMVLDDQALSCIIQSCKKQDAIIVKGKMLYAYWRKLDLAVEQTKLVEELGANLTDIIRIDHQTLFLASHLKEMR